MPLFTTVAGVTTLTTLGTGLVVAGTAASIAGTAYSAIQSNQQLQQQKGAQDTQRRAQEDAVNAAKGQQRMSEMAQNQANRRDPNVAGIMQQNQASGGGTMLTGPTGVDPNALALGKSTLLGG